MIDRFSPEANKTMDKYILSFRKFKEENGETPDVLILDSFLNHEMFLFLLNHSDKFFGCEIYIANKQSFGFEFHAKSDLDRLKGMTSTIEIINYERMKKISFRDWSPVQEKTPIPRPEIKIGRVHKEALRAYQNDCRYKTIFSR